jgi:hypothetical protein
MKPSDDPGDLIRAGYAVLSGNATQPRDWAAFRTYYAPNARLAPVNANADGTPKLEVLSVDDYITSRTALLAKADFYEIEVGRREWRVGNVATVLSVYESRRTPDGPAFARGVNSVLLFWDGIRWWITAITWDGAHAGTMPAAPVPEIKHS